jgi:hypothetical protein
MSYAIVDGILVWVGEGSPAVITRMSDSATTSPLLITGYDARRDSRNVTHDMLDGSIVMTLINPRPRAGTMQLLYASEYDAHAAMNLHATSATYTLETGDRFTVDMHYVAGALGVQLDDATRDMWVVSVDYQEVDA